MAATGLTFDPVEHVYYRDTRPVWQSVTQTLKRAGLFDWLLRLPEGVVASARARGTAVHAAIAYYNEHDFDAENFRARYGELAGYFDAWVAFSENQHFVPVLCEHRVYSPRYDLAGTIDCVGMLGGLAALVDYATGDPISTCKDLQTAAYLLLARDWAAEDPALDAFLQAHPIVRRFGVQLQPDGRYRLDAYTDPTDVRQFLALVEAQRIVDGRNRARERAFAIGV